MSKSIDSNKQFMVGNGILAFGVFFIVCLFLYLGFRFQRKPDAQQNIQYKDIYSIQVDKSFAGDSLNIFINDSLFLSKNFSEKTLKFQVNRFADNCVLMVVNAKTDEMSPYNLDPNGSKITIIKKNGKVFFEEEITEKK